MSSVLYYKFKSSNDQYAVHFDGPHIGVVELRAQIVKDRKIVTNNRDMFLIELSNAQTGEVYGEEALVGRNTAVLVKRVPMQRREPIQGQAAGGETNVDDLDAESQQQADAATGDASSATGGAGGAGGADADGNLAIGFNGGAYGMGAAQQMPRPLSTCGMYGAKLVCPLSNSVFVDAVITMCCGASFSKEPLSRHVKSVQVCPGCSKPWAATNKVLPNKQLREAVEKAQEAAAESGTTVEALAGLAGCGGGGPGWPRVLNAESMTIARTCRSQNY